ncbi:golgi matrix protein [Stemphylium lycopersici]|uniref:Golgi matrix protein n=1 Tax=Stemphylium lycopersici TaxID=183478 RepID=A0A364MW91_STELY|nr:golgi matrix protein [Stemphylium lycopersici]RAR05210.1 golgi matrix protein [Stemphylium lycopersici]
MSAPATSDPVQQSGTLSKSQKKKNKKKAAANANKADEAGKANGDHAKTGADDHEEDSEDDEEPQQQPKPDAHAADPDADDVDDEQAPLSPTIQTNGTPHHSISSAIALGLARSRSHQGLSPSPPPPSDTSARLDAIAKERDALRQEVTELRKNLEGIQSKQDAGAAGESQSSHEEEIRSLREELDEANEGKEHFETQYKNLLGRVNTIKTSLGDRLKADAARIEEFESQVADLEEQNRELQENNNSLTEELAKLREEKEAQASEIETLRSRANLSQQNWIKERDELISREAYAKEEFENAKQAMQDWEVLAMNERSLRENLAEKDAELREQLESMRDEYEKAARDRDTNNQAVEVRKAELKKSVETYESQINELRKQVQAAESASNSAKATLESTQKDLERALPFEKEVKEKNLLIGKLRHEAVTLNEHLTKALRILKKGRPEDNVDRQIITNYFLHFLSIDRSDPKKFEALQLISALLGWTDEQKEQAGLARPGTATSSSSLRLPLSPFRRTPSTPSLSSAAADPMLMASSSSNKESLAELWQDFLEREAAEGKGGASRRGSTVSPPPKSETGLGISGGK